MLGRFVSRAAVIAVACILKLTTALAEDPGADAAAASTVGGGATTADTVLAPALPVSIATVAAPASTGASGHFELADRIVVRKSSRRLLLMHDDRVVAEYPVRLGLNPVGPKEREGDFRTPEGQYWITRRNQFSDFFLSIEVSYPNDSDRTRARRMKAAPGGSIMIHGLPNFPRKPADYYARNDWTDGCIAVSNSDMVDIWLRTRIGLPIEIRP
jgi:murein L,D-transpeptidase YafK